MERTDLRDMANQLALKETLREVLANHLRERGLRFTPEREAIVDVLYFSPTLPQHFRVEDLNAEFAAGRFHISLATLYNNLDLLIDCGLLERRTFGEQICYECCYGRQPHAHAVCHHCGRIWDLKPDVNILNLGRVKVKGFRADIPDVCLYGLCSTCRAQKKRKQNKTNHKSTVKK